MEENEEIIIQPIGYVYSPTDERQSVILDQVKSYCQISDAQPDAETWKYIWQSIRRLSILLCWADEQNDTLITQVRKQHFSIKAKNKCCSNNCCCDEDVIVIPLEFTPIGSARFISGSINARIGKTFVKEEITSEYLDDHTDWETNTVYINREDFPDTLYYKGKCCCLSNRDVRIDLSYNAGYDTIPNALLPVICHLINSVDTDTSDDCASAMSTVSGLLKRKKVGNVEYEWSDKDQSTYNYNKLITEINSLGVLGEVMSLSRCEATNSVEIGDVV